MVDVSVQQGHFVREQGDWNCAVRLSPRKQGHKKCEKVDEIVRFWHKLSGYAAYGRGVALKVTVIVLAFLPDTLWCAYFLLIYYKVTLFVLFALGWRGSSAPSPR